MTRKSLLPISIIAFSGVFFIIIVFQTVCNKTEDSNEWITSENPHEFFLLSDRDFVGSAKCKECHPDEYSQWENSHHDLAMQEANSNSVLGDFSDIVYTSPEGMKTRFYRKGEEFWVNTEGKDGKYHNFKVIYTFGLTPLQQYIIEYPQGRFQCLSTAWDTEENKWFDLYPEMHIIHSEWLHQSGGALNWNMMCADCHSTNVRKNFNESTNSYQTEYSIINVSCEACHGPGKVHVANAQNAGAGYKVSEGENLYLTTGLTPKIQVDQCARCHSRREQLTKAFNFDGTFLDHYYPQLLTEGLYHPDGQILDEVYVYGSFVQSKMYMNNIKCSDCHNPHSLELKFVGNKLCQQCHVPEKYDTSLHTFHESNSEGSKCINCHMTGKLYMVNDYRRDHSFRIPRPDLSIKYQTPNACSQCHQDKSNEWAWESYKKWYGPPDTLHYTDVLCMARTGDQHVIDYLLKLSSNKTETPLVRSTAINYLGRYSDQRGTEAMIASLTDSDPLVRAASIDALREYELPEKSYASLYQLLDDDTRSVRIKAFRALAGVLSDQIPATHREAYDKAKKEFMDYLEATADFSAGQANKAIYLERISDVDNAIKAYQKAIEIDDHNNQARNNLANLYYRKGEFDKAESEFRKIIEQEPDYGYTYYSLGLLLAEKGDYSSAVPQFEKAIQLMPENTRIYYNLGLIYQNLNEMTKAEKTFLDGLKSNPRDEGLLYALVYFYANIAGNRQAAINYAQSLIEYYPQNTEYRQLLNSLKQMN